MEKDLQNDLESSAETQNIDKILEKTLESVVTKTYFDGDKEIFDVIISTSNIDQAGDVMNLDGVDYSLFDITNAVFYNHDSSDKPIAKCLGITKLNDMLIAKVWFHELTEESKEIKALVKAGVINCASIGFQALEVSTRLLTEDERLKLPKYIKQAVVYEKWKLLEFSIVNIPMNAEARILRQMTMEKAGRVLSKTNETRLKTAIDLLNEVVASIGDVEEIEVEMSIETTEGKQIETHNDLDGMQGGDLNPFNIGHPTMLLDELEEEKQNTKSNNLTIKDINI